MNVFVQPTGRRIAPFNDPIGDTLIANRALSEWQAEMLAGFTRVDAPIPPCLVIPDTLFTTPELLHRFVDKAGGQNAVAVLKASLFASETTPVQPDVVPTSEGFRFTQVRFLSPTDSPPIDVVLDPDEERIDFELPEVFGGSTEIGLPRHPMMTLHHWVHILWANQAAGAVAYRRTPKWLGILKLLWALVRAMSFNKWKVLGKLNTIGKNCDIHPTAVVEGSTLGDNVTIGPFARVLFSTLADNASVLTGAEVEACTLGEHAVVGQRSGVRLCVLYPHAFASQAQMQACIVGRGSLTTPGSYSLDLNFDQEIRVQLDGELHSTGSRFLGSAFGHSVRFGSGLWLASGRAIPNGVTAARHPHHVVQRIPDSEQSLLVLSEGTLVDPPKR